MKGSVTVEASYVFPFCLLIIAIVCYLGIFCYNQSVLKTTGYECILWSVDERNFSDKDLQQSIIKKAEKTAGSRVLGVKELSVGVKITTSKIALTFYGKQTMFDLPLEITSVYERTYPERTLRLLSGTIGGKDERISEKGSQ